jgi:hypothetical protein
MVARWYIFVPKTKIWVYFYGSWNAKCWYILWPFGIFYSHMYGIFNGHLVYFKAIGCICGNLVYFEIIGTYFPVLVCCIEKHLAVLVPKHVKNCAINLGKKLAVGELSEGPFCDAML